MKRTQLLASTLTHIRDKDIRDTEEAKIHANENPATWTRKYPYVAGDFCDTPDIAVQAILPFLPKDEPLYDIQYGTGKIGRYLDN